MRLRSVSIAWFRGAAESVSLDLSGKSAVIYGANGAGKSSFVDAIEYALSGKIAHLAHEYSGKRQERAVINTHLPAGRGAEIRIAFQDKSETTLTIDKGGTCHRVDSASVKVADWSHKRTILRQDEVAEFIRDTKGAKYSALLPLLGLGPLEVAAENARQLVRAIDSQSGRERLRTEIGKTDRAREAQFGTLDDAQIRAKLDDLHQAYGLGARGGKTDLRLCDDLLSEIDRRVKDSSADLRQFIALSSIATSSIGNDIKAVRIANGKLAGALEPLIVEKLEVLQAADGFAKAVTGAEDIKCPACGQSVAPDAFKAHVANEKVRLKEMKEAFNSRKTAISVLAQSSQSIKRQLSIVDTEAWCDAEKDGPLGGYINFVRDLDTQALINRCDDGALAGLEKHVLPLVVALEDYCKAAPPDASKLSADKLSAQVGHAAFESVPKAEELARADALATFIGALETSIREEIRHKAKAVVADISSDVQAMWDILHPDKRVEEVHLYVAVDSDKAIDIGLKFFGVPQDSPRLTLSEGYRNSLGLCIFLAMAKREAGMDRPLILDDVVVSLDRQHRGMIVELLSKEFASRQVVLLTHDRDWYAELRQSLDEGRWSFRALLPYEAPEQGIRWSKGTATFDDARALLKDRPDSAGNVARKIMDGELATIAEKLQSRLPFRRGDNNDRRTAHEFLERLIADGKDHYQSKVNGKWDPHATAITAFEVADVYLTTWGNKSSHSFDVVRPEASKLIDACEAALQSFRCEGCKKRVWHAAITGEKAWQCECGQLRWK